MKKGFWNLQNSVWISGFLLLFTIMCRLEENLVFGIIEMVCGLVIWTGIVERVWGDA